MSFKAVPWNKGYTKDTHPSLQQTSRTMKAKGIDNAKSWREEKRQNGDLPRYNKLHCNGDLAELLGAIYGDGSIYAFDRTEYLRIACNSKYPEWVERCAGLIEAVFQKKPNIRQRRQCRCIDITLYQKFISSRLNIPAGAKGHREIKIPSWVLKNEKFIIRYLRGLYETEGSLSVHEPTYTYKLMFTNRNDSLLAQVEYLWKRLGFHPHRSLYKVQISKKDEVLAASELIGFRQY